MLARRHSARSLRDALVCAQPTRRLSSRSSHGDEKASRLPGAPQEEERAAAVSSQHMQIAASARVVLACPRGSGNRLRLTGG
ncbi:unnamed protein product [Rangifer tarandus platyrhynchus]|uniref:Uncharacterized protein n=1 Tax=Rangifer tarandus platyrhynchus TaxID=3082113 RepID=A0ABN8XL16_RANTA|nr:unnamed protein product [Rangifer tarandus platyrhynchus]